MTKRNKIIVAILIILAILLVVSCYYLYTCKQEQEYTVTPDTQTVLADTVSLTVLPVDTLANTKTESDSLKRELAIKQRIIDALKGKTVVYRDRVVQVQIPTPTKIIQTPVPTETRIVITPQTGLDQIFYENGSKNIFFCLRLGGSADRHLPHLAMLNGENFGNSRNNNQSGYNWEVAPGQLSDGFIGLYGVTKDGTFYVSKSLVDRYLSDSDNGLVEIKTTVTGWTTKQMTISGDFYIYKK